MAKKALKKQITNDMTNKEKADVELLNLFGDEETYNRFVLVNLNNKITKSFASARSNSVYLMNEMALRHFDGGYKDFARFHNYDRFDYPVVTTAFDFFYQLEMGVFCCGGVDATDYIKKRGYYDMFNNQNSELIYTPRVFKIDKNHKNYSTVTNIGASRDKNLPVLYMDAKTISAFTQFRIMVYNKYNFYIENGITDKVKELGLNVPYDKVNNNYVAYALALRETANYFKTFYSPDKVNFTNTPLPYKGLSVIEEKVNNIRDKYSIYTVGTLRHFDSFKELPLIKQSPSALINYVVKMYEFKGQYIENKNLYRSVYNKNMNIIAIPDYVKFDTKGRSVIQNSTTKVEETPITKKPVQLSLFDEIDKVCEETSKEIEKEEKYNYKSVPKFHKLNVDGNKKLLEIAPTMHKVDEIKDQFNNYFVEVAKEEKPTSKYSTNSNFKELIDLTKKSLDIYNSLFTTRVSFKQNYTEFGKKIVEIEENVEELNNFDEEAERHSRQEHETYTFYDPDRKERICGSYEEYNVACSKNDYIKYYKELSTESYKIMELENELVTNLGKCHRLIDTLEKEDGFNANEFEELKEVLDSMENYKPIIIGDNVM